ncbi:MAG TPA: glycosyltransferase family 2 protein [Vicinamibacterales bacterium]|jgi:glycosyltransferase involved in cell wall biosynthesis|nr:glycosyltransferase family 2 protein [Vicinamibacterales bacterium]
MTMPDGSALTVIVPALNEEAAVAATLARLRQAFGDAEILLIDDGCTDRTAELAATVPGVRILRHDTTRGYGASIKTGVRHAAHDTIAWYDADGQHTPEALAVLLERFHARGLHAAIGSRTRDSASERRRFVGKAILSAVVQLVAARRMADVNCGLRVMRRSVLGRYLHLLPDGFSAAITSTLLMLKRGYRVEFVPVVVQARIGQSSVRMLRDGLRSVHTSLRILVLFHAFRAFSFVSAMLFSVGAVYGLWVAFTYGRGFPALASVLVLSGVIIFFMGLLTDQVVALRMERLEEDVPSDAAREARVH